MVQEEIILDQAWQSLSKSISQQFHQSIESNVLTTISMKGNMVTYWALLSGCSVRWDIVMNGCCRAPCGEILWSPSRCSSCFMTSTKGLLSSNSAASSFAQIWNFKTHSAQLIRPCLLDKDNFLLLKKYLLINTAEKTYFNQVIQRA